MVGRGCPPYPAVHSTTLPLRSIVVPQHIPPVVLVELGYQFKEFHGFCERYLKVIDRQFDLNWIDSETLVFGVQEPQSVVSCTNSCTEAPVFHKWNEWRDKALSAQAIKEIRMIPTVDQIIENAVAASML